MKKTKFLGKLVILIIIFISACNQMPKSNDTENKQQSKDTANIEINPAPQMTQSVVNQLCRQNLGQNNIFPEVVISEDGGYYKLNAYSSVELVDGSTGKVEYSKIPVQDYPTIYYDIKGIPITTCGGMAEKDMEDKSFCEKATQLRFKNEDVCKLGGVEGKIIVESFTLKPTTMALTEQEQNTISNAAEEQEQAGVSTLEIKWTYIAAPLVLILLFLGYLEVKRINEHKGLMQKHKQNMNIALRNYIATNLRKGYTKEQIRNALVKYNYSNEEIEEAFRWIR